MAPICVHRASRTPLYIAPRHIGSRDGLQEARRTDTYLPPTAKNGHVLPHTASHSPLSPARTVREIHLEPEAPFYAGTRHISGPGGINLCSPAPVSLVNYLIINDGMFQVNFTKPRKHNIKNTPDLTLNEPRNQIVCRV